MSVVGRVEAAGHMVAGADEGREDVGRPPSGVFDVGEVWIGVPHHVDEIPADEYELIQPILAERAQRPIENSGTRHFGKALGLGSGEGHEPFAAPSPQ